MTRTQPLPPGTVRRRRGEQGAALVLAFLVMTVLVVVMFEVTFRASVEGDHVRSIVADLRMRLLARAAARHAEAVVLLDIDGVEDQETDADTDPFGAGGGGGGGGGGGAADVVASTDSKLDEWMHPEGLAPPLETDLDVWVEVVDEDRKINLLGLWTADPDLREAWRDVVHRLLDRAFEGTDLDLGYAEAGGVLDGLDDWVKGRRGLTDGVPRPPLKQSNADDEAEQSELDTSIFEDESGHYPLTLGELRFIDGLKPEHLTGFVQDDEFHPGLSEYLTLWSQLELKPPEQEEDESPFAGSPFDRPDDEEEDDEEGFEADPTNDGLVNVNTASLVVLRALAPEELSTSFLEKLVEFREKIDEFDEGGALGDSLLGDDDEDDEDDEDRDDEEDGTSEDEEDDVTQYVFESAEEIFDKIEEEFGLSPAAGDDARSEFTSRLGTTSQVFSILVTVSEGRTRRHGSWRTVVWRMGTDSDPRMVTLVPLEPFGDARRFPADFPEGVREQAEAAAEDLGSGSL